VPEEVERLSMNWKLQQSALPLLPELVEPLPGV